MWKSVRLSSLAVDRPRHAALLRIETDIVYIITCTIAGANNSPMEKRWSASPRAPWTEASKRGPAHYAEVAQVLRTLTSLMLYRNRKKKKGRLAKPSSQLLSSRQGRGGAHNKIKQGEREATFFRRDLAAASTGGRRSRTKGLNELKSIICNK